MIVTSRLKGRPRTMPTDSRFETPRSLARALAELARRAGGAHALEAELRAALPASMGAWLHARLRDVRVSENACVLVMADEAGARETLALADEISRELRRRLGPAMPPRLRVERAPPRPAPRRPSPRPTPALSERPLVAEALAGVEDARLRRRLARWAGVSIDPGSADGA